MGGAIPPLPHTPSWRGVHFKKIAQLTKKSRHVFTLPNIKLFIRLRWTERVIGR